MTRAHTINSGRATGVLDWFPEAILSRLEPGLFVDVGAAFGGKTELMLKASPASSVIAYEPFAGNLAYLQPLAKADPRINVRPVAVADYDGSGALYVRSVLPEKHADQLRKKGASVVGYLTRARRAAANNVHTIPVVRLDSEIDTHIRFLKVDIQGGEYDLLKGARKLFETHGVDFIYIEFNGDLRVLRFLDAHDYVLFDCIYLAWPSRWTPRNLFRRKGALRMPDWKPLRKLHLSTGVHARHVWPRIPFRSYALYCAWFYFMRAFVCGLQTDLFCVHRSQLDAFMRIRAELLLEKMARNFQQWKQSHEPAT